MLKREIFSHNFPAKIPNLSGIWASSSWTPTGRTVEVSPWNTNRRERLGTVHLLEPTSLDQLLLKSKAIFTFLQNELP
jgi:hypothetical protein